MSDHPSGKASNVRFVTRNVTYLSATVSGRQAPRPTPPWLIEQLNRYRSRLGLPTLPLPKREPSGDPPIDEPRGDQRPSDDPTSPM